MSAKYLLFLYYLRLMIMCHSLSETWQNNGAQVWSFDRLSPVPVTLFAVVTMKSVIYWLVVYFRSVPVIPKGHAHIAFMIEGSGKQCMLHFYPPLPIGMVLYFRSVPLIPKGHALIAFMIEGSGKQCMFTLHFPLVLYFRSVPVIPKGHAHIAFMMENSGKQCMVALLSLPIPSYFHIFLACHGWYMHFACFLVCHCVL